MSSHNSLGCNMIGVRHFPKCDFPSDNFPSSNFTNIQFPKTGQAYGLRRRCKLPCTAANWLGSSASSRRLPGGVPQNCRFGNYIFRKLPCLGKYLISYDIYGTPGLINNEPRPSIWTLSLALLAHFLQRSFQLCFLPLPSYFTFTSGILFRFVKGYRLNVLWYFMLTKMGII